MSKIVILGAAESGIGAAVLAKKQGFDVFVSDAGEIQPARAATLEAHGIPYEGGGHTLSRILDADEVIKSPGIPDTAEVVRALHGQKVPVVSEIEFAARYTSAPMVCITGSNGKTTTTSLIFHILKEKARWNVGLAGNIGKSLALQVAEDPKEAYVLELSSFQLEGMFKFRAHIAVVLNISPDHLDRYEGSLRLYAEAKMRILQNQTARDTFVFWQEDALVGELLAERLKALPDGAEAPLVVGFRDADAEGETLEVHFTAADGKEVNFSMATADLSLQGVHNRRNCLAAAAACLAAGAEADAVRSGLADFPGVEHRLEYVCTKNGVRYINDSKATNVDACLWALKSMTAQTILILGGTDKGNDYSTLLPIIRERCAGLVFLGADNAKLHAAFDDAGLPIVDTHDIHSCVEACAALAKDGETVLLSPCCASFDLFHNMAERGRMFKAEALKLRVKN